MPRAGLTHEKVVNEAAVVADEVGLERLTLAAVADRFGVALPSLYKHVDGLDGLRRDLALLGVRELTIELTRAGVGKAKADALYAFADAYRRYAHAYPGRYLAAMKAPEPGDAEHEAAASEILGVLFALLSGYGITDRREAIDAARMLRAALHGFVDLEELGGTKLPQDVDASYRRVVAGLDLVFSDWLATKAKTRER
jgi:AcrR family transcriptional regulator